MFEKIRQYVIILLGSTLMGFALHVFIVPAKIAPGGVSGLSVLFHYVLGTPVGITIAVLNIPIFILGAINFNKRFVVTSLISMLMMSVATEMFSFIKPITNDVILASVFGGAILGFGLGLVLREGSTTGGTDIVAKVLKKRFTAFSIGRFILIIDTFVVVLSGIVLQSWETVLYSAVSLYVSSYVVDVIVEGVDFAKTAFIISEKNAEIAKTISDKISRGVTGLNGVSMYTGQDKNVLMCVVRRYELGKLKNLIKDIDPTAFVILADVREVLGNGFKNY